MAELADSLVPTVPATAVIAAVAADGGGYAVKLSDDCPLEGRFEVGSITKTFTGVVLASLADEGVLDLDDEIGRWLEAGQNGDITLGQLATHTSGLPRLSLSLLASGRAPWSVNRTSAPSERPVPPPAAPRARRTL